MRESWEFPGQRSPLRQDTDRVKTSATPLLTSQWGHHLVRGQWGALRYKDEGGRLILRHQVLQHYIHILEGGRKESEEGASIPKCFF